MLRAFRLAVALLSVALVSAPAFADGPTEYPNLIPDTNFSYPSQDHACDAAMNDGDWAKAIDLCMQSARDYKKLVASASGDAKDKLAYFEAQTWFEIAFAYSQGDSANLGHDYGLLAYNLFRSTTDPYFAAIEPIMGWAAGTRSRVGYADLPTEKQTAIMAALSPVKIKVGGGFIHLMTRVHGLYPDICPEIDKLIGQDDPNS